MFHLVFGSFYVKRPEINSLNWKFESSITLKIHVFLEIFQFFPTLRGWERSNRNLKGQKHVRK